MFFFQISCWQNVWTVTNFWSSSPLKRVPLIFCVCHQIVTQPQPQLNSKHRITQTKHFSLCNPLIIFDTFFPNNSPWNRFTSLHLSPEFEAEPPPQVLPLLLRDLLLLLRLLLLLPTLLESRQDLDGHHGLCPSVHA